MLPSHTWFLVSAGWGWAHGREWLGGNLELIFGNNTDVHGVISFADRMFPWCCREDFIYLYLFPFSLLVFPGITPCISSAEVSPQPSLSPHTCLFWNVGEIVCSLYCIFPPWHWIFGPQPK